MIVGIYIKWATDWTGEDSPPSLITNMIKMALSLGGLEGETALWGDPEHQERVQRMIILLAAISIPWMLLPKPIL